MWEDEDAEEADAGVMRISMTFEGSARATFMDILYVSCGCDGTCDHSWCV